MWVTAGVFLSWFSLVKMTEVCIETYGCAMNKADSEVLAGLLNEAGFVSGGDGILVVNTCTVKTPTDIKILRRLRSLKGRKVVVSGCMPAANPSVVDMFPDFSFIGVNVEDIVDAVKAVEEGRRFVKITGGGCVLRLPKLRINPVVGIVPIAQGCVGDCSYCITRVARGCLVSYPMDLIFEAVREALCDGVSEIWLTAQDTGAYGLDLGGDLPSLLRGICGIRGDFRVRVGMMNPVHVLDFLEELIEVYDDVKIYKFLHLPLQSGDNNVLEDMGRKYSVQDFKKIVSRFRNRFPRLTISTDVIVGFPSEDDEAFKNTLQFVEEIKPDILNISRFWVRPGTRAAGMKQLPGSVIKQRSGVMFDLFQRIGLEKNKKWIGWLGDVLVSERAKQGFCARNSSYKPIILHSCEDLFGRSLRVEVTDATYYDLRGILI